MFTKAQKSIKGPMPTQTKQPKLLQITDTVQLKDN